MNSAVIRCAAVIVMLLPVGLARAQYLPVVPKEQRGRIDAERAGTHDAANIRTVFYNYGMVGDYPPDPGNVDLSVFHSVEVPKGTGMNYTRRHHAVRPGEDRPVERRPGAHHGDRLPRAAGRQPVHEQGHAVRAAAGILPGRPGHQSRAARPPSATIRAPGPMPGPTG